MEAGELEKRHYPFRFILRFSSPMLPPFLKRCFSVVLCGGSELEPHFFPFLEKSPPPLRTLLNFLRFLSPRRTAGPNF